MSQVKPNRIRNIVFWTVTGVLVIIGAFTVLALVYESDSLEDFGYFRFCVLIATLLLFGWAVHTWYTHTLEKTILLPLQRLVDGAQAIAHGATQAHVHTDANSIEEVHAVADAMNLLADKAVQDIEELKKLGKMRSEFIGNVSHELRTPIFSVQGYLETLLDGAVDDPEVNRQFLEKAYQNAQRLHILLTDLIEISRIESGELRMSFRYFDLAEVLQEVVDRLEHRREVNQVTLRLELDDDAELQVYGDKEKIAQVLTNLVDNGMKYNKQGGTVTISAKHGTGGVRVSVADTGIGIPTEHQERIFERFYRVEADRSRVVGGSGLGLAIVKHILEAHHAGITLVSETDKGTTFSFELKSS